MKLNNISQIRVYIKDNQLGLLSCLTASVSVTLHFRNEDNE